MEIKKCPFCGENGKWWKKPLWQGSHGYHGKYEYLVGCINMDCDVNPSIVANNIYTEDDDEVLNSLIKKWNTRKGELK